MNVFAVVKENVTARQVAMQYGIKINRSGLACCPFHKDKTPSMKIDKRYYCFGCGDTGDAIDFVAKYFGLAPKEAAMKIASDFGLNYDATNRAPPKKMAPKKTPEQILDEEQKQCFCVLSDYYHLLRKFLTIWSITREAWYVQGSYILRHWEMTEIRHNGKFVRLMTL